MRELLYILTISLIGCKSHNSNDLLQGNWKCCTYRGDYFELYIQDKKYKYSTDFELIFPWENFEIDNDTLVQYSHSMDGNKQISKSRIEIISDNQFVLHFSNEKPWTFNRIIENITISTYDSICLNETKERGLMTKCKDQRTEDEIKKDSIDFDF